MKFVAARSAAALSGFFLGWISFYFFVYPAVGLLLSAVSLALGWFGRDVFVPPYLIAGGNIGVQALTLGGAGILFHIVFYLFILP